MAEASKEGKREPKGESVKRPDRAELSKQCDAIMAEILELNAKAKRAKAETERILGDRGGNRGELEAARQGMKALIAERGRLLAERADITVSRDACRDKLNAMVNNEKAMRHDLKFASVEAIDNQIRELELRQARTSMSLTDEKKLVKDIHNLQMSKKSVGALSELKAGVEREKSNRLELDRRITEKNVELKAVNDRTTAQRAQLDALSKEPTERDNIPALRREQVEAREQAEAKYNSIKALRAEFKKKEDAWNVFQAELTAKRKEAKQKEAEARAIEEEARKKQLEAEELARIPYEDEMNLCEHLSVYLRGLAPTKDAETDPSASAASTTPNTVFQGMKVLSRDTEDYAVLGGSKKGKGKKKGGSNTKKETIGHSMDTLSSFALLQITPPTVLSQVPASIEALQQKKASYQGIERGSVPTMAELQEARQGKAAGSTSKPTKAKDFSLEADFPTLATNGDAKAVSEAEEGVSA